MADPITGRYVEVSGVPTYVEIAGEGPGMLCLHTAGRDGRQWHDYLRHFASRFTVIAPDLPGHHKSWPVPVNRCYKRSSDVVGFLSELCDVLGVPPTVLMGCSLGGNLTFELAQRRPDVQALVAFEGADHGAAVAPFDLLDHPAVRIPEWFLQRLDGLVGSRTSQERRDFLRWSGMEVTSTALLADLQMYSDFDVRPGMPEIRSHCLLIRGSEDWIVTEEMVAATARRLTNAASVHRTTIRGAGHFAHYEQPDDGIRAIEEFLEACGSLA